jgi:carbon monoxide dehydrogenase subunit G
MGFRVEERFSVKAPVAAVWAYLIDARRVVTCLPGAELTEVVDERTFHGNVKVKVGAVTASYKGRVNLVEVDEAGHRVKMTAEGREGGGAGSAKMTMESRVTPADGGADVVVQADVDITGRLMQLGRGGLFQQVAHQIFGQFASCVQATLEAEATAAVAAPAAVGAAAGAPGAAAPAPSERALDAERHAHVVKPVRALPLLFKAIWAMIVELFRGKRPHPRRT